MQAPPGNQSNLGAPDLVQEINKANSRARARAGSRTGANTRASAAALALALALLQSIPAFACPCAEIPRPDPQGPTGVNRTSGIAFTHTPAYRKEFAAAIAEAKAAILRQGNEERLAIVADIDETLLDNRQEFAVHPQFKWSEFAVWMQRAEAPVLKPTADFLAWARARGYAIFLVTGRPEKDRAATIANLVRRGVAYDGLYMRPDSYEGVAETIKTEHRQSIEQLGFKIVVNIGDQFSDLYGGHAIECVKLPNKMYYIP